MVGCYVVEDEYTVNIKLKRYLPQEDSPTNSPKESQHGLRALTAKDDKEDSQQPLFTLGCSQPVPAFLENGLLSATQPTPTFTLVPPKGSQLTSVSATHLVNGVPEKINFFLNKRRQDGSHVDVVSCGTSAQEAKEMALVLPTLLNKDGGNLDYFEKGRGGTVQNACNAFGGSATSRNAVPHKNPLKGNSQGNLSLPSVQVFSDDNCLVSKNTFSPPSSLKSEPCRRSYHSPLKAVEFDPSKLPETKPTKPRSTGSLYVSPIKQHCPSGSGELFVSKVDPKLIRKSPMDVVPTPGNSRRTRPMHLKEPTNDQEGLKATEGPPPLGPSSTLPNFPSSKVLPKETKKSLTFNSSSLQCKGHEATAKEAARALLAGLLNDQIMNSYEDQEQPLNDAKGNCDRRSDAIFNSKERQKDPKEQRKYKDSENRRKNSHRSNTQHEKDTPLSEHLKQFGKRNRTKEKRSATFTSSKDSSKKAEEPTPKANHDRMHFFTSRHQEELRKREAEEVLIDHERCNICRQLLSQVASPGEGEAKGHGPDALHKHETNIRKVIRNNSGDRVVEAYNSVTSPGIPLGGRDSLDGTYRGASHVSPVAIDPAHLTSLDLEDKPEVMLVTNEAQPLPPSHSYKFQNHFNNNNNNISKGPQPLSGSGSKYLVDRVESPIIGHENLAFDASGIYSQDEELFNPVLDSCFCDPGYGSDRSEASDDGVAKDNDEDDDDDEEDDEEEEFDYHTTFPQDHTLTINPPDGVSTLEYVMGVCPFINEANMFDVTVVKNLRGLGLAVTGGIECDSHWPGLIRIKKIYPQTPAWLCGQLKTGDFLLEANHKNLTGLTSHEALEVLRTAGTEVHLVVSRPPEGGADSPAQEGIRGDIPAVIANLTAPQPVPLSHSHHLSPSPSFSAYGEFEVQLTKVGGSLGFTLRKQDNSILGHTIRTLVKEPAISDGRIRPGDKLLSVNGMDMCGLSHEEAVKFLRTCPETVVIRLYRDAMQTPVSPASPAEPEFFSKPKQLRKEARDMLSDLAFRKQSPNLSGISNGDRPGTPRRRKLQKTPSPDLKTVAADRWESLVKEAEDDPLSKRLSESGHTQRNRGSDASSNANHLFPLREEAPLSSERADSLTMSSSSRSETLVSRNSSNSSSITPNSHSSESRPQRPTYLDLSTSHKSSSRKSQFTPPHEADLDFQSPFAHQYISDESLHSDSIQQTMAINSAPLSSTQSDTNFAHLQQGYHSVNLGALPSHGKQRLTNTSSDHDLNSHLNDNFSSEKNSTLLKWKGVVFTPEDDEDEEDETSSTPPPYITLGNESSSFSALKPKIVTIEMTRGWNSRLGFSLQPLEGKTTIVAIYADSVAAKDGRLKVGDQVLEVNDVDITDWHTEDVIDLLRKTRGKISLKVLQQPF